MKHNIKKIAFLLHYSLSWYGVDFKDLSNNPILKIGKHFFNLGEHTSKTLFTWETLMNFAICRKTMLSEGYWQQLKC